MRVFKKMDESLKKSLVWACLYDHKFVRAGKITSSYYKALEILLELIIMQEGGKFKDAEDCIIEMKCRAWGHRYYSTSIYNYKEHIWQGGHDGYLGWNILKNISEPNTSLIEWLSSINAIAFYLGQDSCWTPCEFKINGEIVWEEEEC